MEKNIILILVGIALGVLYYKYSEWLKKMRKVKEEREKAN